MKKFLIKLTSLGLVWLAVIIYLCGGPLPILFFYDYVKSVL